MDMFTGALIMRVDGTTGGAPSALWKLAVDDVRVRVQPRLGRVPLGRALPTSTGGPTTSAATGCTAATTPRRRFTAVRARERPVRNHRPRVEAHVRARAGALRDVCPMVDAKRRAAASARRRDSLYTTWADTGDCFVVPWETPGETHKGKHDDKHDNHRRLAAAAAALPEAPRR